MPLLFTGVFGQGPSQPQAAHPTDPNIIKNLPVADKTEDCECYICLEKLQEGKPNVKLPCGHAFDKDCIERWLKDNNKCPCCRHELPEAQSA